MFKREKIRVVTTALFHQRSVNFVAHLSRYLVFCRDFRDYSILDDFDGSLERSLRTQLTESGLYMGMFVLPRKRAQTDCLQGTSLSVPPRMVFDSFSYCFFADGSSSIPLGKERSYL